MAATHHRLTPTLQQTIVAYIRAGGFPHVAAEAAGVPSAVFDRWCQQGERPGSAARYRAFALAIRQAIAQARLSAEVVIHNDKPLDWLRYGPGRETTERIGWTGTAKPRVGTKPASVLLDPQLQALFVSLIRSLESFPEARSHAAAVLGSCFPEK
jgi:hypothetical protein